MQTRLSRRAAPRISTTRLSAGPTPCWRGCSATSAGECAAGPALPSLADDKSIQVHACHGPARQVDVLRDVLVGLLADDETLQPSDILVMCPDIEAYAPLIQGAFGLDEVVEGGHPAHGLRVRLADRALQPDQPAAGHRSRRLLELADGRVTASEVLDLAAWAPVRRRFGFDDDELERYPGWAARVRRPLGAGRRSTAGRSARTGSAEHLAGRAGSRAARGGDGRGGQQPGSARRCRWTTSAARTSTWPAGSPNCWPG